MLPAAKELRDASLSSFIYVFHTFLSTASSLPLLLLDMHTEQVKKFIRENLYWPPIIAEHYIKCLKGPITLFFYDFAVVSSMSEWTVSRLWLKKDSVCLVSGCFSVVGSVWGEKDSILALTHKYTWHANAPPLIG